MKNALAALGTMQVNWENREAAAQAAATRFLNGGRLLVAGSLPRFDGEWLARAGGLTPIAGMGDPTTVTGADVVVYGCFEGNETEDAGKLAAAHGRGALVIAFGGAAQKAALDGAIDHFLPNELAAGTPLQTQMAAAMDLAQLWAFTGDLVGACTRAGKLPTMWQSIMVPGSSERNARYQPLRFHEDFQVPAQQAGSLGRRYLEGLTHAVARLSSQEKQMAAASAVLRQTVKSGRTVFHLNVGHFDPALLLPEGFGVPLTALAGASPEEDLSAGGQPGDSLLLVCYTDLPTALLRLARERGVTSICMVGRNPSHPHDPALVDVLLDPQWALGDAIVEIPGYDVKVLPPSGVLNSLAFYAVLADALAG